MWEFEWDKAKRLANLRKHEIDFVDAVEVFNDPRIVFEEDLSERYGEVRMMATGAALGKLVTVVFTDRGEDLLRLISARPATKREKNIYGTTQNH